MPWGYNQAKEVPEAYCPQCGSLLVAGRKKGTLACTLCGMQYPAAEVSPANLQANVEPDLKLLAASAPQIKTACQHALDWLSENRGDPELVAELRAALAALDEAQIS